MSLLTEKSVARFISSFHDSIGFLRRLSSLELILQIVMMKTALLPQYKTVYLQAIMFKRPSKLILELFELLQDIVEPCRRLTEGKATAFTLKTLARNNAHTPHK